MNKITSRLRGNRFIPSDKEELSALQLIKKVVDKVNDGVNKINEYDINIKDNNDKINNFDKKIEKYIKIVDELPKTNAVAEVVEARKGEKTLGDKINTIDEQLETIVNSLELNVLDFGAKGDGVTDDTNSIKLCIDKVRENGGGSILFPKTTINKYLISEIFIDCDYVTIKGDSRKTTLIAKDNNKVILKIGGSNCILKSLKIDGNGKNGIIGLGLLPKNESGLVNQNYNEISNLDILNCDFGVILQCGNKVNELTSGCWYNTFNTIHIRYCKTGIYFKSAINSQGATVNRNKFYSIQITHSPCECGVNLECGDTNEFYGLSLEGITNGIATGVLIGKTDNYGRANNFNRFFGITAEVVTTAIDNSSPFSEFYGCAIQDNIILREKPSIIIGGDSSIVPFYNRALGINVNQGSTVVELERKINDVDGEMKQHSIVDNSQQIKATFQDSLSKYWKLSGIVEWWVCTNFTPTDGFITTNSIKITLPVMPSNDFNKWSYRSKHKFAVIVKGSGDEQTVFGTFDHESNSIIIPSPNGGWNNSEWNMIDFQLRYYI